MKKKLLLSFFTVVFYYIAFAQSANISITLPANPPANTGAWGQGSAIFNITASGNMAPLIDGNMLVFIKSGNSVICGSNNPANAQPSGILNNTPKTWGGNTAASLLGQNCTLPAGQYEVCVQFYGYNPAQQSMKLVVEKCKPFIIMAKEQEQSICSPPTNINPTNNKTFTETEVGSTITFNWSPLIKPQTLRVTYHLLVWEVEDGQSNTQAMYSNLTVIDKIITAQTRFVAIPNTLEKREGLYVWRVIAEDENGKPICDNAKSEPTNFKVVANKGKKNDNVNTACGNGDFESGILDASEWSGGYTQINVNNNATYRAPFTMVVKPTNANPVDDPLGKNCGTMATPNPTGENHQVIVSVGFDPLVPTLKRVPASTIANKYALRLGNNCPGWGAEKITKTFVVPANKADYKFMYALVLQVPANHSLTESPSLWVKVYDASGAALSGLVYLDPTSSTPMDRAIADYTNPYWKLHKRDANNPSLDLLYREWACAKIDLSTQIGKQVTIEIITNDCAKGAHFGYAYLDNFCVGCDNNPPPSECCTEEIKLKGDKITVDKDSLNIQQDFNFSPKNITNVVAEIVYVEEENMDASCMDCTKYLNSPFHFISKNTAKWGSAAPHSASPSNSTAMYPSKIIKWASNKQGNVKFNFNIGLPGTVVGSTCKHKGKICIRYLFTNEDCVVCEKMICYNY